MAAPAEHRTHPLSLVDTAPPVGTARRGWRSFFSTLWFLIAVGGPIAAGAWYLMEHAADRYASRAAFSIRSNDQAAPLEIFGAVAQLGNSSAAADGQILYDFIQSQQLVEVLRTRLPLERMWNRTDDPLFRLGTDQPVEEILDHWDLMTDVSLDHGTGILTLEVRAFRADDAQALTHAVLAASVELVNTLSEGARADAVRFAADELKNAEVRLREIRAQLIQRRLDSREGRRPAAQLQRNAQGAGKDARAMAEAVGDYEELLVNREFAEEAYKLALQTYEQAQAEARRRHRHLAVHIQPTLSEDADYPDKAVWLGTIAFSAFALWSVLSLVLGNLRERR